LALQANASDLVEINGTQTQSVNTETLLAVDGTLVSNPGNSYATGIVVAPSVTMTGYTNYNKGIDVSLASTGASIAHSVVAVNVNQPTAVNASECVVSFGINVPNQSAECNLAQPTVNYGFFESGSASTINYFKHQLGIGNAAPGAGFALDVTGNVNITGNLNVGGTFSFTSPLTVPNGGTGLNTLTANAVMLGAGVGNVQFATAVANTSAVLASTGAASNPAFRQLAAADLTNGTTGTAGGLVVLQNAPALTGVATYGSLSGGAITATTGSFSGQLDMNGGSTIGTTGTANNTITNFNSLGQTWIGSIWDGAAAVADTWNVTNVVVAGPIHRAH